jgi:hypothetical protein
MSTSIGTLYRPTNKQPETIYKGFSWPCLALGPIWFAVKGLWLWAVASSFIIFITFGISWLVFPFVANGIYRKHLLRNGWLDEEQAKSTAIGIDQPVGHSPAPQIADTATSTDSDWTMKTKETPFWKFLLGMNVMKSYQLDCVERKGDIVTVTVLSGKQCKFRSGEFEVKFIKSKEGNRDFTFKNTVGPPQKITFRETLLQMPEAWWDDLAKKLGASEKGWSKVLHGVKNLVDNVTG